MPRLSEELRRQRRREVLTSAWGCFSREGFHATSMDQVIAASGMSSNSVYRYFAGKDELIDATVDEAFREAEELFAELLDRRPTPGPGEALSALVTTVRHRGEDEKYDLSRLAMQAWTEALRRPHLRDRTHGFYATVRRRLEELARRWQDEETLRSDASPEDEAQLFVTLMPGLIVMEHVVDPVSADQLLRGLGALADTVEKQS